MRVAKEAQNKDRKISTVPKQRVARQPSRLLEMATKGEIIKDCEIDRPPMSAYSNLVASGKVELLRKYASRTPQAYSLLRKAN